ncbi:MAG: CPBP family intramembrane metalloprotease [Lachnospiraceae bacterium]|nr:CPBP family intramembrane metalloprotease [Lachnospiraceae bacterium]
MNSKKANLAFLISIICYIAVVLMIPHFLPAVTGNLIISNVLCEMVILLPGLLFVLLSKEKAIGFLGFRKIKISTVLAIIPFTMLTSPFITLVNLISQFFVENEVTNMVDGFQMTQMPFWQVFGTVAIFAPFCEELACRGVYYHSHKKSGGMFKALLVSSLIFAMVHMNINQASYAFVVGVLAVLLVEATGSLWSSIIYHGLINGSQMVLLFAVQAVDPQAYSQASAEAVTTEMLVYMVAVYLAMAAVCLPLGWALLVWISGREGRSGILKTVWEERKKKDKVISVSLIVALILCIAVIAWTMIAPHLM